LRERLAPQVAAGYVDCARCGDPIEPGEPWDLDHVDGQPDAYLGPSHASCNRATAKPAKAEDYHDDPERGIFWRIGIDGKPARVSRRW
jgi:hypothetical protein